MFKEHLMISIGNWINDTDAESIEKLKELLSQFKIDVSTREHSSDYDDRKYYYLCFDYNEAEILKLKKRNAGRRPKTAAGLPYLQDIEDRLKAGEKPEDVAASLGLSRSTFYRKLKLARDNDAEYLDFI